MENRSIWLVSGKSPHKAALCGDPGISKLPGEINSPGSKVFASGKNAWTRQKARGRRAALSAICRGRCFKFGCSIIRTWKTNPSDWSPADHPTKLRFAGTPGFQNSRAKSIRPGARFLPPAKTLGRAKRRGAAPRPFGDLLGLYFKFKDAVIQTWRTDPSGLSQANRRRHPRPSAARCGSWRPWGRRRTPLRWK